METKSFVSNFASQFDDTEADTFKLSTKFRELEEWSSLTVLSIIGMINEEYSVHIKGDELKKCETIQDLFEMVKSKL